MMKAPGRYCGDKRMADILAEVGSPCTLHEVYGLFYGCLAAPGMVMPSQYIPLLLGDDVTFESMEDANRLMNNLMSLWNLIAGWEPRSEAFSGPAVEYPVTATGLKERTEAWYSFVKYFLKGLDLGGTCEDDFTDDAIDALETLSEAQALLQKYSNVLSWDTKSGEEAVRKTMDTLYKLESVVGECIGRINMGLQQTRMRVVEQLGHKAGKGAPTPKATGERVGRNDPCPCGSGKKYKKCCLNSPSGTM